MTQSNDDIPAHDIGRLQPLADELYTLWRNGYDQFPRCNVVLSAEGIQAIEVCAGDDDIGGHSVFAYNFRLFQPNACYQLFDKDTTGNRSQNSQAVDRLLQILNSTESWNEGERPIVPFIFTSLADFFGMFRTLATLSVQYLHVDLRLTIVCQTIDNATCSICTILKLLFGRIYLHGVKYAVQ